MAISTNLNRRTARGKAESYAQRLTAIVTCGTFALTRIMKTLSSRSSISLIAGGLTALALMTSGCSSVALDKQGDMEATYVAGEFRMLVNGTAPATAAATSAAFKQLGLFQIKSTQETYSATLRARTPKDEKVTVGIAEVNSRQTMVRIRVDIVGDKNFSRKLYEQIDRNLSSRGGW